VESCTNLSHIQGLHFDHKTIHDYFSSKTNYAVRIMCKTNIVATYKGKSADCDAFFSNKADTFPELIEKVKELTDQCVIETIDYYFPDTKNIIHMRKGEILCIDYGNYNFQSPGDTLVCSIKGAEAELNMNKYTTNEERITKILKSSNDFFILFRKTKNAMDNKNLCSYCEAQNNRKMMMCSNCRTVRYCNEICQKNDWATHKKNCDKAIVINPNKGGTIEMKKH
jgi:hypothetical protein